MRYAGIIKNDVAAGDKVCVTFFTQGCPHRCSGCHNPETWEFDGGKEFTTDTLKELLNAIEDNGVDRNFAIQGGEPMCKENLFLTYMVINEVKKKYPDIKIYLWTGYTYEELCAEGSPKVKEILDTIDVLVDGPFIEKERDITLPMRGSKNQRILNLSEIRGKYGKI